MTRSPSPPPLEGRRLNNKFTLGSRAAQRRIPLARLSRPASRAPVKSVRPSAAAVRKLTDWLRVLGRQCRDSRHSRIATLYSEVSYVSQETGSAGACRGLALAASHARP